MPETSGTLRSDSWTLMVKCVHFKSLKNKKTITRNHLQDEKQQKYDQKTIKCWLLKCMEESARKGLRARLGENRHVQNWFYFFKWI